LGDSRGSARIVALIFLCVLVLSVLIGGSATARNEDVKAPRSSDEQQTITVYKKTNEAVVFISTVTLEVDLFAYTARPHQGSGSGIIIDAQKGIIITNLHVIQDAHKIEIFLADQNSYRARLVGHDGQYDIAVLQLIDPPPNLTSVEFADSSKLEVGQRVLAIGNPHGLNRTLTTGIISSLDRTIKNPSNFHMKGLIQTDAAINPGNSGGPLLDLSGRLIGMNSAILSASGDSAGIGFAVPANQIRRILPELIATGRVLRPDLGWVLFDTNQGPMVARVLENSAAAQAGVQPYLRQGGTVFRNQYTRDFQRADFIMQVNGRKVYTREDVEEAVSSADRGQSIKFTLRRGGARGRKREVEIKPFLK
ncbi:trypsin-like peptidase domain-containing protein, partial [Oligoflexia bacterium]|nr:trypsin-like peptidase domain-containing protein [Oligoflexia bacterium]